ncbi:MAG: FecR family protein [Bacteroidales bacterium]
MNIKDIDKDLLLRFIAGKVSEKEKVAVLDWVEQSKENSDIFCELKNMWVVKELEKLNSNENGKREKRSLIIRVVKYAAIIILALTIPVAGLLYFRAKNNPVIANQTPVMFKYVVNTGVKGIVDLPDGSKVWLNSSSYIICPQQFSGDVRELELEGEGYFEVVPNKEWPMLIKTSKNHSVKVTGTKFNLSAYSNDNKLVVTLISGEVSLINNKKRSEIKLTPKQELVVIEEKEAKLLENPNISNKTAWKEGLLLFDNTPMDDVVKKMERWYGVNFVIKDSLIFDYRFTAKFRSESITQVLEILRLSSNIRYKIENTTITLAKK